MRSGVGDSISGSGEYLRVVVVRCTYFEGIPAKSDADPEPKYAAVISHRGSARRENQRQTGEPGGLETIRAQMAMGWDGSSMASHAGCHGSCTGIEGSLWTRAFSPGGAYTI